MPAATATATSVSDFAHAEHQLGMVNPPRRVKRLREIALRDPSSSITNVTPAVSSSSSSSSSPPRASSPPASTSAPRRRGRKPAGPLSKSAREQLRKTNHSVIEKRRREKINEALAALRELVPHDTQGGEGKEDKEFKLEVLVRTVEHLRAMVAKVKKLEGAMCQTCGGTLQGSAKAAAPLEDDRSSRAAKRKRVVYDEDTSVEDIDDESRHTDAALPGPGTPSYSKAPLKSQPPPRLPSISSWMSMDHPVGRPSPLANSHAYQLPSPPHTAPFAPTTIASGGFPPRLVLPSPIASNSSAAPMGYMGTSSSHPGHSPFPEHTSSTYLGPFSTRDRDVPELPLDTALRSPAIDHRHMLIDPSPPMFTPTSRSTLASPLPPLSSFHTPHPFSIVPNETSMNAEAHCESPLSPWSRDDQTAASLLLNISSRPRHSRALSGSGSESGSVSGGASGSESVSGAAHQQRPESPPPPPPMQEHRLGAGTGTGVGGRPVARHGGIFEAQTPSSVLGMGEGS